MQTLPPNVPILLDGRPVEKNDEAAAFDSLVRTGRRKLPWRYKWSEAIHDEVLARLLDLNQQRHLEEVRGHKAAEGAANAKGNVQSSKGKGSKKAKSAPKRPPFPVWRYRP